MDAMERRKIVVAQHVVGSLRTRLDDCSVAYVDTEDGYSPSSGTLLQIDNRLLVATAGHTIPTHPNRRLFLIGRSPKQPLDGMLSIIRSRSSDSPGVDVGYLEIDPQIAPEFLDKKPCPIDCVSIAAGSGAPNRLAMLVGAPSEYVEIKRSPQSMKISVIAYVSAPLAPTDWANKNIESPVEPDMDVILDYPTSCQASIILR